MNPQDAWQAPPDSGPNPGGDAIAAACAAAMFGGDRVSRGLDATLEAIAAGRATVALTVTEAMLNGHDTCHGGFIATLADSAFAFACNSYNELTVASSFSIDFLAPARQDDLLTARAQEVSKAGRTGVYDIEVTNQRGKRVAVFRGRSYTIQGKSAVAP